MSALTIHNTGLTVPENGLGDWWLTAAEIALLHGHFGIQPTVKQNINAMLKRGGWSATEFSRPRRKAKGRPFEYRVVKIADFANLVAKIHADFHRRRDRKENSIKRASEIEQKASREASGLTMRQRKVMYARSRVLQAIDDQCISEDATRTKIVTGFVKNPMLLGIDEETICTANDRSDRATLHKATLLRWFKLYDQSLVALAPAATKAATPPPDWFMNDFLPLWARPQKPTLTEALATYKRSGKAPAQLPSYEVIRRNMKKIGNVERHRGRERNHTLKSRLAYVKRSTADLFPGLIYTADGKTFDAEVAHPLTGHPFRPEITSVVDVATRKCVGFSVDVSENSRGVADALRLSCQMHGVCAIWYIDNGSGFKNKALEDESSGILERLGITSHHSIAYNSQARGIIERFNGSVWNPLSRLFDSYVGRDMDRQARMLNFKVTRKDIREFGQSRKLPSWQTFQDGCMAAIAEYNEKPHRSLPHNMSPNEYWADHVRNGFEPVTISQAEADDLFRPYEKRRVQRCIVKLRGNEYFSLELTEWNGDDVLVGYDLQDANKVWLRQIDKQTGGMGPLICVAEFAGNEERYIPKTMERDALERRAKAQAKRLTDKLDVVNQQLRPAAMLEQDTEVPLNPLDDFNAANDRVIEHGEIEPVVSSNKKMSFGSDAELANWAISNPENLSEGQRSVLQECLRSKADRDLLEQEGVDVECLRNILRNAA